ncbi:acyl-CoA dehydrogenase family protein [uncultured Microbacterium sp.]|uniref:acyl-CoA dehydrogenase family protein n=1 Tax=uncultured Microbacterium sp. TaxID=191216 RepID=UPI0028DC8E7B|nr:acyl-CoA dehydrogenase family protein [uncultured Microbacterium sp.]
MSDDLLALTSVADVGIGGRNVAAIDDVIARIATASAARDRDGDPERGLRANVRALASLGLTAARLPVEAGGAGLSYPQLVDLQILLARADANVTQSMRTHFTASDRAARAIARREADAATDELAAEIGAGRLFAGATTEGTGEVGIVGTTLRADRDGILRLNGRKAYATGTGYADWIQVLASDDDGRHLVAVVRADADGITRHDDWHGVGQRLTTSGTVEFTDVAVDPARVRAGEAPGADRPGSLDAVLQLTHLATLAGIALRVRDDAVAWLRGRTRTFSHASHAVPADDPQLQERIGTLEGLAQAVVASVRAAAAVLGTDLDRPRDAQTGDGHLAVTRAQVTVPALVLQAAQSVFDLGGGSLVDARLGLDRHWRNARTLSNHNPVHLKARALGERALGGGDLPAIWYVGSAGAPATGAAELRSSAESQTVRPQQLRDSADLRDSEEVLR